MRLYKRISIFAATTLSVLFASVFLQTGTVNAQSLNEPRASFGITDNQPVVEEKTYTVLNKDYELTKEQLALNQTHTTKAQLEDSIEQMRLEIEALEAKVKAKKSEDARLAEVARVAEIARKAEAARVASLSTTQSTVTNRSYSSAGNTYGYGYCTWYVKNVASWIPNGLGNANTWASRASSYGLSTGSTPRAGAVGTTTRGSLGHVVYVRSVNTDGTVNISDMNYAGWNVVTYRTVPASQFFYIYQ
jgi:surface antigen